MIKVLSREADRSMLGFSREVARAYSISVSIRYTSSKDTIEGSLR